MTSSFSLVPPRFQPLSLKAIRPTGWLKQQLQIQRDGLSGNLDLFWPDIQLSRWFGGEREGWERAPYWLDGVIPLAELLEDAPLAARLRGHMDYILTHQSEDGWLGPLEMTSNNEKFEHRFYDVWAQFLIDKVLIQYADVSADPRVEPVLEKNLRCLSAWIDHNPIFNWGLFRWFEGLLSVYWLYERRPAAWLLDLAVKLQAQGFHWKDYFERWPDGQRVPDKVWTFAAHVVNNAMAVKAGALWYRLSGDQADAASSRVMIEKLAAAHGDLAGIFSGDECLAGKDPTQGTELCAVVDYAFSLENLISILGDAVDGDHLEKVIFNALPATFLPDMWSHQYDQQINQVECSLKPRNWTNNGDASNLFGLEPNYGCCTSNLSQGWPKFAASLWMASEPGSEHEGLAAVAYAPCKVEQAIHGTQVQAEVITEYPFRDSLEIVLTLARPVTFPLYLRIPAWAKRPTVMLQNGQTFRAQPGTFLKIEREWHSGDRLSLVFPMQAKLVGREGHSVSIERGPLVYALKIAEEKHLLENADPVHALPHGDWELVARSAWNYALQVTAEGFEEQIQFEEKPVGELPFSPEGAPVVAFVQGRPVPEWQMDKNSAGALPPSPVTSHSALEKLELIPYGCTNLRIAQFPTLK